MTITLNVNQINYLLDTYFEVYVNGKFYTTINNQYYKKEFEELLNLKN